MRWAFFQCAKIIFLGLMVGVFFSNTASAWQTDVSPEFIISDVKATNSNACSGHWGNISVAGQGSIQACIMGEDVKIASYFPIQGPISYAINFPFDSTYYPLDVCTGFWGCMYSESNDQFIGYFWASVSESRLVVYENFVKSLSVSVQNGVRHYGLIDQTPQFSLVHPSGSSFFAQNAAISPNGKWILVEVRSFGFYRIHTETYEIRRVIAPGVAYTNYGPQPSVQLAISNDGQMVAVMGNRMGVWIVKVLDGCGDLLTVNTGFEYTGAVTPCAFLDTPTSRYIDNFLYALLPQFSQDSKSVSFNIYGNGVLARHVTLISQDTSDSLRYYLAIGDSFTSGEGETDDSFYIGGAVNKCHVSSRAYPYLVGAQLGYSTHNAACSGATMLTARETIRGANQLIEVESRLPQRLTVGIGGNDAGLMGKLKTCLGLDTCEWASSAKERQATALEIKSLYPKLRLFYDDLKTRIPGKVIVVGYPKIISQNEPCFSELGLLLNQTERTFMNEGIHYLNEVIRSAANDSEVEFIDIENVFSGNELCHASVSSSMNGIRLGDDYSVINSLDNLKIVGAESFHPTPTGHDQIKQRIIQNYQSAFSVHFCNTCSQFKGAPNPASYWDGEVTVKRQAFPFLSKIKIKSGETFEVSLPMFSFEPNSEVTIELHSDVQILKNVQSADDGSVKVTLSGNFEPGHHSIHLIGKSANSEPIEVYDFIAIEESEVTGVQAPITNEPISSAKSSGQMVTQVNKQNDFVPAAILGASTTVSTVPAGHTYENINTRTIPKKESIHVNSQILPLIIAAILGATITSIGVYIYFQQKHP